LIEPPGYVGYDEGGRLQEAVRRRPYSVVLLDEIERRTRGVRRAPAGARRRRLTDGQGRSGRLRNTVLIMTSNIAAPSSCAITSVPSS
jgi:ATP-dependent Clp protease ATP-binding subunit ClpB